MRKLTLPRTDIPHSFTIEEARAVLRCSRHTVTGLITKRRLKAYKIGRSTRITGPSLYAVAAGEEAEEIA